MTPPSVIVTVSGRVLAANGRAIRRARVMLVYPNGSKQTVQNSAQNGFVFDNVAAGQTYTITVVNSRLTFTPVVITINDNISGLDLIANP